MAIAAVQFDNVSFTYPGAGSPALEGVRFDVASGERLGILGPNGGGKSTLLKLALGLLDGHTGTIRVLGLPPAAARRARLIGYVPQRVDAELGLPLSVRQVVTLGAAWRTNPFFRVPAEVRRRVDELLALVGAAGFADRPVGGLSGGQLQRVMIARALAASPKLLVLDEPTVGIDAAGQAQFAELLATVHRRSGVTLLVVSHDLRAVAAASDRVACLARTLHYHDAPHGLTPAVLADLFSHDIAGISGSGPLAGMHVHAHGPGEACPVTLGVSAPRQAGESAGPPGRTGGTR